MAKPDQIQWCVWEDGMLSFETQRDLEDAKGRDPDTGKPLLLGMVAHAWNPSTWVEAAGGPEVQNYCLRHGKW